MRWGSVVSRPARRAARLAILATLTLVMYLGLVSLQGSEEEQGEYRGQEAGGGFKEEVEENIYWPDDYDTAGCPTVPLVFAGMTGRLGNLMSTYANLVALQWRLGYKVFLPHNMYSRAAAELTKPYITSIFQNVTFPTATWDYGAVAQDAKDDDLLLFNNSRTGGLQVSCPQLNITRVKDVRTAFEGLECRQNENCPSPGCESCPSCPCPSYWVTIATGANFPDMKHLGPVIHLVIEKHLQFHPWIQDTARGLLAGVRQSRKEEAQRRGEGERGEPFYVGVHVRRTDFVHMARYWLKRTNGGGDSGQLFDETFWIAGFDHFRASNPGAVFLIVSDDMAWCREHLSFRDTYHVGGSSPEVDMSVMAQCNASIIDYGTFGLWGAVMAGGETVVSKRTFRDVRWAADYLGWTYI